MTKTNVEKTRELEETVKSLKAELESALKREQQLKLIIEKLKHAQFGRKSERRTECDKTLPLFPVEIPNSKEGETDANVDKASKTIEIEAHSRKVKVKSRGAEDGEAPEGTFPSDFPRQTLVIDEKPEGVADEDIELIDTKVTERLGTIPQTYYVQRIERKVYKQKSTGKFYTPELPEHTLARRCKVTEECIIMFIINKFMWHLPLYRQQQQLRLQGINISRDSLTKWVVEMGGLFSPIAEAIAVAIRGSPVVHIDETPIRVGKDDNCSNTKYGTGYFWPIMAAGVGVSFFYKPTRCWSEVDTILKDFGGVLVSDAYEAYEKFAARSRLILQLCWMHIRRNFIEAERSHPKLAGEALAYISEIYRIERTLRELSDGARAEERMKQSKPVLDQFHQWLVKSSGLAEVITDDYLAKAVSYVLKRWENACVFLNHGAIPIDNGRIERAQRPTKLGLKNWLHCASEEGAEIAAVFYTLIGSALMHGIHPYYYLLDLTKRISDPTLKAVDLIPGNWKLRFHNDVLPEHLRNVIPVGEPSIGGPRHMSSTIVQ